MNWHGDFSLVMLKYLDYNLANLCPRDGMVDITDLKSVGL